MWQNYFLKRSEESQGMVNVKPGIVLTFDAMAQALNREEKNRFMSSGKFQLLSWDWGS